MLKTQPQLGGAFWDSGVSLSTGGGLATPASLGSVSTCASVGLIGCINGGSGQIFLQVSRAIAVRQAVSREVLSGLAEVGIEAPALDPVAVLSPPGRWFSHL